MAVNHYRGPLKMVVCDWAGTTVDHGCMSPMAPFIETLRRHGVELTADEARGPMGLEKQAHLQALLDLPRVAAAWRERHGRAPTPGDVAQLFQEDFVPLQLECVARHSVLITGLLEAVAWLRGRGLKVVTTTGYFHEAAQRCFAAGKAQGFEPDANLCATDVPVGRPAPFMIFRHMERFGVYPPAAVLKIGDTLPDIEEGLNAGAWSTAVCRSSSDVGLTEAELAALPASQQQARVAAVRDKFLAAGAHAVVDTIADLPRLVEQIESRLAAGEKP